MEIPAQQTSYWNRVAAEKTFGHPLDAALLEKRVGRNAAILDVGCGYGRLGAQLRAQGFTGVIGVDPSAEMIGRGKREAPELDLRVTSGGDLPFADASFDAALLFTVLTSTPATETQQRIVAEIHRVLRPGGILIVSDLLLQADERNRLRYESGEVQFGTYGVFALPDGGVCRHHTRDYLGHLLRHFTEIEKRELSVVTMNGHPAVGFQFHGSKPGVREGRRV